MLKKVVIVDFGSQVTQLIARSVRSQKVYCEVVLMDGSKPGYFQNGIRGVAWDIHEAGKMDLKMIDEIKYEVDPEKGELSILEERE